MFVVRFRHHVAIQWPHHRSQDTVVKRAYPCWLVSEIMDGCNLCNFDIIMHFCPKAGTLHATVSSTWALNTPSKSICVTSINVDPLHSYFTAVQDVLRLMLCMNFWLTTHIKAAVCCYHVESWFLSNSLHWQEQDQPAGACVRCSFALTTVSHVWPALSYLHLDKLLFCNLSILSISSLKLTRCLLVHFVLSCLSSPLALLI